MRNVNVVSRTGTTTVFFFRQVKLIGQSLVVRGVLARNRGGDGRVAVTVGGVSPMLFFFLFINRQLTPLIGHVAIGFV